MGTGWEEFRDITGRREPGHLSTPFVLHMPEETWVKSEPVAGEHKFRGFWDPVHGKYREWVMYYSKLLDERTASACIGR